MNDRPACYDLSGATLQLYFFRKAQAERERDARKRVRGLAASDDHSDVRWADLPSLRALSEQMMTLPTTGETITGTLRDGRPFSGVVDFIHPHDFDHPLDAVIILTSGQIIDPVFGDRWERVA